MTPTPWSGNAVITGYLVSGIVWGIVYLARSKGHEIDPNDQNVLVQLLTEPISDVVALVITVIVAWYTRLRVYSEMTVSLQKE